MGCAMTANGPTSIAKSARGAHEQSQDRKEIFNAGRNRWLGHVARDPKLSGGAVRVAILLWDMFNAATGGAWPSIAYMAKALMVNRSTVILAITSPTPECGKTTLLSLLNATVPRPLPTDNITLAAVFGSIEAWRPTLLVDEADTFLNGKNELRGVLNGGHHRDGGGVIRMAGPNQKPRRFDIWAPKAIALIGRLPPTLESRAISIELRRMAIGEHVEPLRGDRLEQLEPLRRQAWSWARDNNRLLEEAEPAMPETLRGRTADNWRHMVAIADAAGGDWPERARRAAEFLTAGQSEHTTGIMLLEDLRTLFEEEGDRLPSTKIVEALVAMEGRPWANLKLGKPITQNKLAELLEPFKVKPGPVRARGYTPGTRGYKKEDFAEAFKSYLPPLDQSPATPPQPRKRAISRRSKAPQTVAAVAEPIASKPAESNTCGGVAVGIPVAGAEARQGLQVDTVPETDQGSAGQLAEPNPEATRGLAEGNRTVAASTDKRADEAADLPPLPAFLDRSKNPRPGDQPGYAWLSNPTTK